MALMATRTKLFRLLTTLTTKAPILGSGSCSNGVKGLVRVDRGGGLGLTGLFDLCCGTARARGRWVEAHGFGDLGKIGEKYGVEYSEAEILNRYRRAYGQPWGRSRLRYVNDGRPFWQYIVSSSTGCSDSQYFEELYNYYTTNKAWHLCDPDAGKVFQALRKAGVKVAVVSNFDTRLRPLLQALNCEHWFDAVAVSAEVEAEKPNPTIFLKACELLGVKPEDAVHVGDDRRNDIWGARDAGCDAWLWGSDVHSFKEVAQRVGVQV
ncbi:hypothetical protein GBA52_024388 [Prunus armeniaca]|nr:hypothetical protein GBA52_024388 [Prunus armeniaca]